MAYIELKLTVIKELIYNILSNLKNKQAVKRIGVFGSVARNDYNDASDIDIALDYKHPSTDLEDILLFCELRTTIRESLENHFNRSVDVLEYNALYSKAGSKLFKDEIDEEMIWIYGQEC